MDDTERDLVDEVVRDGAAAPQRQVRGDAGPVRRALSMTSCPPARRPGPRGPRAPRPGRRPRRRTRRPRQRARAGRRPPWPAPRSTPRPSAVGIRDRFGDEVVRAELDGVDEATGNVDRELDGNTGALCQRLQDTSETSVVLDRGMETPGEPRSCSIASSSSSAASARSPSPPDRPPPGGPPGAAWTRVPRFAAARQSGRCTPPAPLAVSGLQDAGPRRLLVAQLGPKLATRRSSSIVVATATPAARRRAGSSRGEGSWSSAATRSPSRPRGVTAGV